MQRGSERLAREVYGAYTCGSAGGGGVRTPLTPPVNTSSGKVPREAIRKHFRMLGEEALT